MTDSDDIVARLRHRARAALDWYGPARAFATAGSIVVVCLGAWWLLRAPSPPLENSLPFAGTTTIAAGNAEVHAQATISASTQPSSFATEITVHVVGAVLAPGVYVIAMPGRVIDAVSAAGGPTASADLSAINLALPLADADQVYVPSRIQSASRRDVPTTQPRRTNPTVVTVPQAMAAANPTTTPTISGSVASGATGGGRVNINTADVAALETLPGVGPTTAKSIVAHRQANGPFASPEGLLDVKGIGDAKFAAMKPFVVVS